MKLDTLIFPIIVFIGGCCFGPSASTVKLAYAAGYSSSDVVMIQYFFAWLFILLALLIYLGIKLIKRKKIHFQRPTRKTVILIVLAGISISMTSLFFILSLQYVPAHIPVILLFQYTWMGIILESVYTRKLPRISMVISVIILIIATFLAVGMGSGSESLDIRGIVFGLLSAVAYAVYITILGKIDTTYTSITRSFFVLSISLLVLTIIFTPNFYVSGVIFVGGLWKYGIIIGLIGCALPSVLFSIGTPKISAGAATILSSSELPASIICAVIILSESVFWLQWVGIFLMFFGIALPYMWEYVAEKRRKKFFQNRNNSE